MRATASLANASSPELWIGKVEPCEEEWGFTVFGPDKEPLTRFVSDTREQAERAREVIFTVL
ncbi:MAG TPA: hypothetical protein VGI20_02975 [Rhizomicrobium sp.]